MNSVMFILEILSTSDNSTIQEDLYLVKNSTVQTDPHELFRSPPMR